MARKLTTLPTSSRMAPPSGQDAADSLVATLEASLLVAFGPQGKGVLLREPSSGALTMTRAAREITRTCFDGQVPPPWLVPVLRSADDLRNISGDGGKGIVLGALAVSRMSLSPSGARGVLGLADQLAGLSAPEGKIPQEKIPMIVRTCLKTRFAPGVLSAVLPSLCNWLDQDCELAFRHFESLVRVEERHCGPVSESVCSSGVTFLGMVEGVSSTLRTMRLMVLQEEDVPITFFGGLENFLIVSRKCLEDATLVRVMKNGIGVGVVHGLTDAEVELASQFDCKDVQVRRVPGGVHLSLAVLQLVLRAPVPALSREIRRSIRDALAVVCSADGRIVRVGAIERCILRRLLKSRLSKPPAIGRPLLLALTVGVAEENDIADALAGAILDLCRGAHPDVAAALGVATGAVLPPVEVGDDEDLEPVLLRLAVLQGALSAGARAQMTAPPLPAHRLHS